MSNLIHPTLRVYLTDFVGTDKEDEVIEKITKYGNEVNNMVLFFWFDQEKDKVDMARFVKKWDRIPHNNFKTIIRPQFFDLFSDFIWYDILPKEYVIKLGKDPVYTRFSWRYANGIDGVLQGLDNFKSVWDFTVSDKPPKRKQKRNDYEDSYSR